jgi:hypothetical protein
MYRGKLLHILLETMTESVKDDILLCIYALGLFIQRI